MNALIICWSDIVTTDRLRIELSNLVSPLSSGSLSSVWTQNWDKLSTLSSYRIGLAGQNLKGLWYAHFMTTVFNSNTFYVRYNWINWLRSKHNKLSSNLRKSVSLFSGKFEFGKCALALLRLWACYWFAVKCHE